MLILLTRIDARPAGVTRANVEDQVWIERVRPGATIVSSLAATGGRAFCSNWIEDSDILLRIAKEDVVVVAEAVIDSELEAI